MKHITKYTYDGGKSFNGYRVAIQKKGVVFCEYVPAKDCGWDKAEKKAIELEEYLAENLAACNSQDEAIQFYLKWRAEK